MPPGGAPAPKDTVSAPGQTGPAAASGVRYASTSDRNHRGGEVTLRGGGAPRPGWTRGTAMRTADVSAWRG
ncbi:hypothetical protein GCM10010272_61630 [Streptomyces lateritius]|nr:hypothetical protein GCM10010272_61630 [Streptomyces lateritius]